MISKYNQIKKYINKWQKRLFLQNYRITFEIASTKKIKMIEKEFSKDDSYAFATVGYPLKSIHIIFNPKHINKSIERTVIHELLHCHLEPVRQSTISLMDEYITNNKFWNIMLNNIDCRVDELIEKLVDILSQNGGLSRTNKPI